MTGPARWNRPPFVLVRRQRDGDWTWEARSVSNAIVEHPTRPYSSLAGAQRAARKVGAARSWPVITLPNTQIVEKSQ